MIGQNIRFHRLRRFMSQPQLGAVIDVTQQQIQKYEEGADAIPAIRLFQISRALRVPIAVFFEPVVLVFSS